MSCIKMCCSESWPNTSQGDSNPSIFASTPWAISGVGIPIHPRTPYSNRHPLYYGHAIPDRRVGPCLTSALPDTCDALPAGAD